MLSRMKFEIEDLVDEILDQLPAEVWTSTTTTFFDPAIGGGQFVNEIENRLRVFGHSDDNIKGRVSGCESSKLNVKYAVNKNKLVGNYEVCDFLEKDFEDMKFDVVVGNPPYTDGSKANTPLYDKFIKKASELSSNVVAFVTPTSFAISDERGATETRKCLIKDKLKVVKFLGSEAFENANVDTLYYVADKSSTDTLVIDESNTPYHMTFVADEFIHKDKIVRDILIKCGTVNSKRSNFKFTRIDSLTTVKNQVPVLTLLTDVKEEKSVTNEIDDFFNDHKIVSTFLPNAKNHLSAMTYVAPGETVRKNYVVSVADSASIAKNTVNYLKSNLCCFIYDKTKTSRTLRSPQLKFIPKIDLSRSYTDDELYAHFNLSEEEIAYIEANVK